MSEVASSYDRSSHMQEEVSSRKALIISNPLVVTHDGEFHADEVVGVSLLKIVFGDVRIVRTRDREMIEKADIVLDVGGVLNPERRRFDHHQISYSGEMASAGLLLQWLEEEALLDSKFIRYLKDTFIHGVDLQDSGLFDPKKGICTFSDIISFFNPVSIKPTEYEYLEGFIKAIDFTMQFMERVKLKYIEFRQYHAHFVFLVDKIDKMPEGILLMDDYIPHWKEYILEEERCKHLLFVVFPQTKTKWVLHTIPSRQESRYSDRKKLPREWGGLLEDEFEKQTGLSDAVFCHKQRFMAVFKSKKAALAAAELAMKD